MKHEIFLLFDSENENDLCPVAEPGTETDPGTGVPPSSGGVQFV